MKTPLLAKADALDLSVYNKTDYAEPLRMMTDFMIASGKNSTLGPEIVAR